MSDGDKRAAYDRYGDTEGTAMNGHRQNPAGPGFGQDGFDPEEIFNMFFNGGFGGNRYALKPRHALPDCVWLSVP